MIACVLALALIAAAIGQETTSTTSTIASTTTEMQSESTSTMASSTTSNDSSNSDSLTTTNATTFNDASTTTIDASISSIDTNDGSLTTTTTSLSNGTTSGRECLSLPVELKTAAFGCEVDFRLWRVDCKKDIPLPNLENRVATAQGIAFELVRCPANESLKGRVSFRYALDLPSAIKSAADVAKLKVPDGNQIASRTVPINVTGHEVIVPIWPSSGIVELDVDGKLGNAASRKLGIAVRLFNVQLNSTHVMFDVGLRVAPGSTTFTDMTIARDVKFGFDDVCCMPGELLCPDEKEKCMAEDIGIKKWLFGAASATQTTSGLAMGAAAAAAMTTMMMK